jgi:serine/threonine protein kinase
LPLYPGDLLGPYELGAKLGEGGMGEVYRARDKKLGRDVAIKVLPADVAADTERLARFKREAQVLASLNHPNIAAIYGLDEADHKPFLVLELVEGEYLALRLKRGPVQVDEALEIAKQIRLNPGLRLSLTPDGKSLTYSTLKSTSNLWLMEGLDTVPMP